MEIDSNIFMEVLKDKIKDSCTTEIANWIIKVVEESCNEAYERTQQGKVYHRLHSMCTLCSYAKYNPETHSYECRKDFENDCRIMYNAGGYFFDKKEEIDGHDVYYLFDNELLITIIFIFKDGRCIKFMESLDMSYRKQHGEKEVNLDEVHTMMVKEYLEELK